MAWILWYYRLYNAAKKDAAFTYAWFFLGYLVHIFWCIWSAVCAPLPTPDCRSLAFGWLSRFPACCTWWRRDSVHGATCSLLLPCDMT